MSNQALLQLDEVSELDTPKKRLKALLEALEGSVGLIIKAAAIFHSMKEAGDDLSGVPSHLTKWLTKIHAKTVLPEVFVELGVCLESVWHHYRWRSRKKWCLVYQSSCISRMYKAKRP